jgi:hypothetical protein
MITTAKSFYYLYQAPDVYSASQYFTRNERRFTANQEAILDQCRSVNQTQTAKLKF